ncbi:carboxymuconolactone decarboxylase family protein [Pseudomonas aeruginosa]|jgi:alkylhydroperoxidase family enzyme|uniref:Carboxymuconolactone decarboxylase family protein n=3 Tax=Pseudomonas fluorescens group TaxID=136843 RepID=A0A8I1E1V4_9PSED|nr:MULTISPECIES: carboxymuconolactone decarboxylase family protein [Pseudomonas]KFJ91407.1 carboxymuconolactone decarboxylase [Pseudomonas sp. 1-7]KIL05106.1 carboxymuconolactone decarboxylase [Stutzerimonas stutzeri]MPS43535.1 carboxymuconolactone decarboxylase family protein [Stenotrophomonas sp.]EKX3739224.1 carboxymuconolactone decarboxylase family protein [Pseudomonas aeruginosa]ELQ8103813.1 carboxymuconolactone decarboxylase family protein [Pseudomonas aeruginosa]
MPHVRVKPWQDGDEAPAELLQSMRARRPNGELIGIDRVLLKSFPLAMGWNGLLGRVRAEFELPLEYRELIMCRVAVLNRAEFEWNVHQPAYLQAGGTQQKCDVLRADGISSLFDNKERALLELTDQSTRNVEVDEVVIEKLKELFGEQQTVEAVATVAAYNMVSRFLVALAI